MLLKRILLAFLGVLLIAPLSLFVLIWLTPARAQLDFDDPYHSPRELLEAKEFAVVSGTPWATEARYVPGQVYAPENVDRNDVNPRPLSSLVPSSGLTGCYSADEKVILAIAWEPFQEVFQGVISCMHTDFRIGGLKPGEKKQIRGKIYVLPAKPQQLIKRYEQDSRQQSE